MSDSSKQITVKAIENSIDRESGTIAMQLKLRQAMFDSIKEDDIADIIKKQVEKAKAGDQASLQFVMKYVLGFGQPTTLQQLNIITTDVATAAKMAKTASREHISVRREPPF